MAESIAHLESRVEKLEDGMKPLAALPTQLDMLIQLQRESNADTKELAKSITENYASKELCQEKHKTITDFIQEFKDFRKWIYGSLAVGAGTVIIELSKYIGGK